MVVGGTDSGRIRRDAAMAYMEWAFDAFDTRYLFNAGQAVGDVRVQNGDAFSLEVASDKPIRISVPKGSQTRLNARIVYDGPLRAPIAADEVVAELVVSGEGVAEARIPLKATKAVGVAGPLDRVVNAVMNWFA